MSLHCGGPLGINRRYTCLVKVRTGSVTAYLNGKQILSHKTNLADLQTWLLRSFDEDHGMAVYAADPMVFYAIEVTEISIIIGTVYLLRLDTPP